MIEIMLTPDIVDRLSHSYKLKHPRECCGVLLGVHTDERWSVIQVVPLGNSIATPGGFALSDHEMYRAEFLAKECGLECIFIYHSHVRGGTRLSDSDIASLCYSEMPWVVIALNPSSMKIELAAYEARTCTQLLVRLSDPDLSAMVACFPDHEVT